MKVLLYILMIPVVLVVEAAKLLRDWHYWVFLALIVIFPPVGFVYGAYLLFWYAPQARLTRVASAGGAANAVHLADEVVDEHEGRKMGLLSFLTGGVSEKYESVQEFANQLSVDEAVCCYGLAHMQLCLYLEDPFIPGLPNKTAYVEALTALYERLRGSDPWFSMNKGAFRMALTKAVLPNYAGENPIAISGKLGEFKFDGDIQEWSLSEQERLGRHVQNMLSAGP